LDECELTILMPCLNEAETLAVCIKKAKKFLEDNQVSGEVLISDNGSTDGSQKIAQDNGARITNVPEKGYGSALIGGTKAARGKYVIMGDADDSYDFTNLMPFLTKLREGFDLVMGNRFKGGIAPGAMPASHRYLGNPVLSGIGRLFFHSDIGDFHCGLRGYNREAILKLGLRTTGMEYASEMVVKATLCKLKIAEVPTTLSKDGRSHPPHLRSFSDGWRHLRFLLVYSPNWLFLYPGMIFTIAGLVAMTLLLTGPVKMGAVTFDITTLLYSSFAVIIGTELMLFSVFSKVFGKEAGLLPGSGKMDKVLSRFTLEKGLTFGTLLMIAGIAATIYAFCFWAGRSFGALNASGIMRIAVPALMFIVLGIQLICSSFYLYILRIKQN
jgi:glycosyltransferase involved in cell wall biosynthesis